MKDYVIINGVSSKTKTGLAINILPPITKPQMRTLIEEIDGRDGDIITKLGYSSYDKTIEIGLFGNGYDVDDIIAFFNKEGTIVFSNEPTKYYNFTLLEQIDIERLLQFKTSTITFHCQPFKYEVGETPKEIEYDYVSGEGTEITLNNTMNALMQLELNPSELTQETTTGANIYYMNYNDNTQDFNGVSVTSTKTGYSVNGSRSNNGSFTLVNRYITLQAGSYTLKLKHASAMQIGLSKRDYATINRISIGSLSNTFTLTEQTDVCLTLVMVGNVQYNEENEVMIYSGTTEKDFEEYTGGVPQPNPSFPSEVQVIKGNNTITISNSDNTQTQVLPLNLPVENLISSATKDGNRLFFNGNAETDYTFKAGTYTLSFVTSKTPYIFIKTANTSSVNLGTSNPTTFTMTEDFNVWFYLSGLAENDITNIQLEKGDKANQYTPYGTTPIEYCKIGTYEDEFEHSGDKWYLNKYIGKVVFDGSESFTSQSMTNNYSYQSLAIADMKGNTSDASLTNYLCDYFKEKSPDSMWLSASGTISFCVTTASRVRFCVGDSTNKVDDFKTWLSTHNTTVYYVLATPTHEEITDTTLINQLNAIEQAVSYDGQTNISQTNAQLPFRIKATAMISGSDSVQITNNGNIYAKPILDIKGSGLINVYLNGTQMFSVNITDEIVIDIPNLETYNPNTSALMNRYVTGNISNFILPVGVSTITVDGAVEKVEITFYQRWL